VVILTGTGAEFSGPRATPGTSSFPTRPGWDRIDRIHWEGRHLLMRLLEIEVPMISAINGPAWRHSEIPLLCDIVLAADTAQFQDSAHFPSDVVPGDGMHIVMPLLLGLNRGRYYLLTGQTLDARKAHEFGLVAEVLPPDRLMARAWELAEELAKKPTLAPPDARSVGLRARHGNAGIARKTRSAAREELVANSDAQPDRPTMSFRDRPKGEARNP
jgi:enoyl-CoA hydratase/carnithine racemase